MPFPLTALIPPALGALGGLFGNRNRSTTEQDTSTQFNNTQSGTSQFNNALTSGFSPEFAGVAGNALGSLQGLFNPQTLDPAQLRRNATIQRAQVNRQAGGMFNNLTGGAAGRGLAFSPSSQGLARGLSESFRGSGLLGVNQNLATSLFNLPGQQEALNSPVRSGLLNLLSILPRTQTSTGTNTTNNTNTGTSTGTSTGQTTGNQGGGIGNMLGGALGGFAMNNQINDMGGLLQLLGLGGNNASTTGFRTPDFNPNAGGGGFDLSLFNLPGFLGAN